MVTYRMIYGLVLVGCSSGAGDDAAMPDAGPDVTVCGIALTESGSLDLDLRAVRVTGRITLDGAALPNAAYAWPQIELRGADGSSGALVDLDGTRSSQYDVRVLPGTYDVVYSERSAVCTGTPYPCQQAVVVKTAVAIDKAGVLDIDIPTVHVAGRVTLDGAAPPAASYRRPAIDLRGIDKSTGILIDLERVPSGNVDVRLIDGTYDLIYADNPTTCTGMPYPCQEGEAIKSAVAIHNDGQLDLDIKTIAVSGRITLDGATLPAAAYRQPVIALRGSSKDARGLLIDLERTSGTYQVRLLPGRYDIIYREPSTGCTGSPFPCQTDVVVRPQVQLATNGVFDVDIKTVGVSGRITLDGAAVPNSANTPPLLALRGADHSAGVLVDLSRATTGNYQVRVIPGSYDILYTEASTACTGVPWPCQQQRLVKPAVQLTTTGVFDLDVRTALVTGRVTLDKARPPAGDRVLLQLRGDDDSTGTLVDLARDPDGAYQRRVIAGTYKLLYDNPSTACTGTPWPCQHQTVIREGVAIAAGAFDVDIATIGISGRVTLDGAPIPMASYTLPDITLLGADAASGTLVELSRGSTGSYQTRLVPGRYVVRYDEPSDVCTGAPYPCQVARAIKGCGSTP